MSCLTGSFNELRWGSDQRHEKLCVEKWDVLLNRCASANDSAVASLHIQHEHRNTLKRREMRVTHHLGGLER